MYQLAFNKCMMCTITRLEQPTLRFRLPEMRALCLGKVTDITFLQIVGVVLIYALGYCLIKGKVDWTFEAGPGSGIHR